MKTIEAPRSLDDEKVIVHTVDTSKLQRAYPSPKTAKQREYDLARIWHHNQVRRPRHAVLKSTITTTLLFCVMILLFGNLERILWSNPLFGVPFWFGVMFGLLVCWRMFLRYVLEVFSAYSVSIAPFAITYSIGFCVISAGIVQGWFGVPGTIQSLIVALSIHAILVASVIWILLGWGYRANDKS